MTRKIILFTSAFLLTALVFFVVGAVVGPNLRARLNDGAPFTRFQMPAQPDLPQPQMRSGRAMPMPFNFGRGGGMGMLNVLGFVFRAGLWLAQIGLIVAIVLWFVRRKIPTAPAAMPAPSAPVEPPPPPPADPNPPAAE